MTQSKPFQSNNYLIDSVRNFLPQDLNQYRVTQKVLDLSWADLDLGNPLIKQDDGTSQI